MTTKSVLNDGSKQVPKYDCDPDTEPVEAKTTDNVSDEISSFIFTVCVKSVPFYHFKLAYVILHIAVK